MSASEDLFHELPGGRFKQILYSVLEQENLITGNSSYKIKKVLVSRWMSSVYTIEANCPSKILCLYLKCLPEDNQKRDQLQCTLSFRNEAAFYNTVLPVFEKFQSEKSREDLDPPVLVPQCYAAESDGTDDVVILKDMFASGFVIFDRFTTLKLSEMCLLFKKLGRFHAYSLALKILSPDKMNEIKEKLIEPVFVSPNYESFIYLIFYNNLQDIRSIMKENYDAESKYLNKFETFITKGFNLFPAQTLTDPTNEPYNVLTHGDLWISNFLYHYPEGSTVPDDICFLDFQQIRYNSPAIDLGRFLFAVMDKPTRHLHRDYLLQHYYESLGETLRHFGLAPEYLLPFSELESQLRKYSVTFITFSLLNVVHARDPGEEKEYGCDGDESVLDSIRKPQQAMSEECRQAIFDIIEECVDRGYMDF